MDVTIDNVNAQIQRQPEERQAPIDQPYEPPERTETDRHEHSFMTRCERLRARRMTY